MTFDLAAIRTSRYRVPRGLSFGIAAVAVIALFSMMNANAQARWSEMREAFENGAEAATAGRGKATRIDAPGTIIMVGDPSDGMVPVTVKAPSQEVCFYGWTTFAPLSASASFARSDGDIGLVITGNAGEDAMALENCAASDGVVTYQVRRRA